MELSRNNSNERVGVDLNLTINLGNYNSAKVGVWRDTVIQEDETEEQALARIWEFVTSEVDAKVTEITADVE